VIWIFWAIVVAAMIYVADEYRGGFVERFSALSGFRITRTELWIVNTLFMVLCLTVALFGDLPIVFRMPVTGLILINALLFHVGGAIRLREYSPGLVSALVLYVPLALSAYLRAVATGLLTPRDELATPSLGSDGTRCRRWST
jgi:hypothetical protein